MHEIGTELTTRIMQGSDEVICIMVGPHKVYPNYHLVVTSSLAYAAAGGGNTLDIDTAEGLAWTISGLPIGWSASAASGLGPTIVTITASNNTTTSTISGTIVVSAVNLSANCTLSQAAGTQTTDYSAWTTESLSVGASVNPIVASGGSATLTVIANQARNKYTKWNGIITDTVSESQTPDVSGSATYAKASGSGAISGRVVTFGNNASLSARSGVFRATYDGEQNDITISQVAGSYSYANPTVSLSYPIIPASGGSVSPQLSYTQTYGWHGSTSGAGTISSGAMVTYTGASNNTTGAVTTDNKGTAISTQNTVATVTATVSINGKSGQALSGVYQAANARTISGLVISKTQPDSSWTPVDRWDSIPASGGYLGVRGRYVYAYDSGSTVEEDYGTTLYQSDGLVIVAPWAGYWNNGGVRIESRRTIAGAPLTGYIYWTNKGLTSPSLTFGQVENKVTGIRYGIPLVSLSIPSDIPASGGTISSGTVTYSQSRTELYSSSSTLDISDQTTEGEVSYSLAITGANLGATDKARTALGTLTATVTMNGKSGAGSETVYQAANTWYDHDTIVEVSASSIEATGGSITVIPKVRRLYTSGTYSEYSGPYGAVSGSASGFTLSGSHNSQYTLTASNNTSAAARSITIINTYGGLVSPPITITQSAGIQTTEYSDWVSSALNVSWDGGKGTTQSNPFSAGLNTVSLVVTVKKIRQRYTKWNGIITDTTTEEQIQTLGASDYTYVSQDSWFSRFVGAVFACVSRGSIEGAARSTTATFSYDNVSTSVTVYQEANAILPDQTTYKDTITITPASRSITSSAQTISFSGTYIRTTTTKYSSGGTKNTDSAVINAPPSSGTSWITNSSNSGSTSYFNISANASTTSSRTGSVGVTTTYGGAAATVTQAKQDIKYYIAGGYGTWSQLPNYYYLGIGMPADWPGSWGVPNDAQGVQRIQVFASNNTTTPLQITGVELRGMVNNYVYVNFGIGDTYVDIIGNTMDFAMSSYEYVSFTLRFTVAGVSGTFEVSGAITKSNYDSNQSPWKSWQPNYKLQ